MDALVKFMASTAGRVTRVVAGIVLIFTGLVAIQGPLGIIVTIIGVIPFAAGALDYCLLAPLFGHSVKGSEIRKKLKVKED